VIDLSKIDQAKLETLQRMYGAVAQADRLSLYAQSLKIPCAGWTKNSKDEIQPTGDLWDWVHSNPVPGYTYPYAHKYQRYMTYPFEDEKFDRFKEAVFYLFFAGNKGGKTVWGDNWPGMEFLGIHPLQLDGIRPKPPLHWWIVSPNLPSESDVPRGEDAPILKKFYEWMPDADGNSKKAGIVKFYRKDKLMTVSDGHGHVSVCNFKSHDQEKGKYKSEDVDGILYDEEPPKPLWDEGLMRVQTKKGIILLSMTTDWGSWTWSLLRNINDPRYWICEEMDALENPFMPVEYRKKILSTMDADQLEMRRFGRHIQMKGKVFPFVYNNNVGRPFQVNKESTIYVIIDWHPAKPVIISYLAINPKNIWYVFRESVVEEHVVERVVKEYNQKLTFPDFKLEPKRVIIDKIANIEQASEKGYRAKSILEMLRNFGINCKIGLTDFNSAQAFLARKLKYRELWFDPSCILHIEQFDTWGAKRYQKGNLEGTLRDQLESEGNDTCINLVYAYNGGAKFSPDIEEMGEEPIQNQRPSTARIYGNREVKSWFEKDSKWMQ
jgi:phage terminase large subunit-like protein